MSFFTTILASIVAIEHLWAPLKTSQKTYKMR